jgi:type I restriction enzyme S subunit
MSVENLITDHLDIWTSAIKTKSAAGRGSSKKQELVGIKKLRKLILELAVRGKLVLQDPNDKPASELLKKIEAEKASLLKEGKIKKQKPLPSISDEEKPFELPDGWSYTRLDDLCATVFSGSTPPKSELNETSGIPFLKVYNIQNQEMEFERRRLFVTKNSHVGKLKRSILYPRDVLMNLVGPPLGKVAIIPNTYPEWNCNQNIICFRPLEISLNHYIYTYLKAHIFLNYIDLVGSAGQDFISGTKCRAIVLPMPPLAEQNRIVSKVDELMALCDQLEAQTEASIDAHKTLVEVLLATLTDAKDADELNDNWQTISQHFDVLFTTQASIDQLKQTILQLAVMGKLVKQDPSDEPACKLLERIAGEKSQLIADKKIKQQKPLPAITDDEKQSALPIGWGLTRLDDICFGITSGSTPPKDKFNETTGVPYLKVYNIKEQSIAFDYRPQFVDVQHHKDKLTRSILHPGDVVMNIVGPPLGKIAIIPDDYPEWNCNQAIVLFRPIEASLNSYIYTYLTSGRFLDAIELIGTAGQDNISVTKSRSIIFPMPPLAEQHRIVAKVDELMALCDSLKIGLSEAQSTQLQLTDTIVEQAL